MHNGSLFLVTPPIDGETRHMLEMVCTVGFAMTPRTVADAWHAAGVANGGKAIEDPPGVREGNGMKLYLAYLRDPDGNKLCALHRVTD